jgi:hypothetical protein
MTTKEQIDAEYEALETEYRMLMQNSCDYTGRVAYARRLLEHVERSLVRMGITSCEGEDCPEGV